MSKSERKRYKKKRLRARIARFSGAENTGRESPRAREMAMMMIIFSIFV